MSKRKRPKYMSKGEDPAEIALLRDKPLYSCSKCKAEIHASDVAGALFLSSIGRTVPIHCPSCGHLDPAGERRTYGMSRDVVETRIRDDIHNKFEHNIAMGKYETDKEN